ncbi:hypothetical protein [Rhodoflexus caldus]|uniref:hypothetical protein n=1 Tax=Rhodoflexus caldus TaxID=2891236 RepID=UPI00202A125E|nr:hypothetical protein [Rhodoflexus caldus]
MPTITLKYHNPQDLQLLLMLAERLGIKSVEPTSSATSDGAKMSAVLEQLASINAFASIQDPVEWQREIRKDRNISE